MPKKPSINSGDCFNTNEGYVVEVIEYINHKEVIIRFDNGIQKSVQAGHLQRGVVKNPLHPSVCGVGYVGDGPHLVSVDRKATKTYDTWAKMIKRCYDTKCQERQPTYQGCSVCEEWHNFQNFAEWYYRQPNANKKGFALDKDLITAGNKQYSPENCSLVPQRINNIILNNGAARGEWPQGVYYHKISNKYLARISIHEGASKHLGLYETPQEAFAAYKRGKEKFVKEQAEKYKDVLHPKVYENLMSYEVKPA